MYRVPNVLFCGSEAEAEVAKEALRSHATLTAVHSLAELGQLASEAHFDALFCGSSFHCAQWRETINAARMAVGDLPVIFLSPSPRPNQWQEVMEAGGFDLLLAPYSGSQALAILEQAVESHLARGRCEAIPA